MPLAHPPKIPLVTLPTVVQFAVWETSFNLGLTPAFPNNVTPGNSLIVLCFAGSNSTPVVYNTPTDTIGNTFLPCQGTVLNDVTNSWQGAGFWCPKSVNGSPAADTVTVTKSGGAAGGGLDIYIAEVSGLVGFESGSANSAASGSTASSGSMLLTRARGFVIAGTLQNGSTNPPNPAGAGYYLISRTPNNASCFEYATGVTGSQNAQASLQGSMSWMMLAAAFYGTP